MIEIKATVTKTVEVSMRPYVAFCYFDAEIGRRIAIQYAEYHDGVFSRALQMQDAPPANADPILAAVEAAMIGAAQAAMTSALAKEPEDRDDNETYLAALIEASQG